MSERVIRTATCSQREEKRKAKGKRKERKGKRESRKKERKKTSGPVVNLAQVGRSERKKKKKEKGVVMFERLFPVQICANRGGGGGGGGGEEELQEKLTGGEGTTGIDGRGFGTLSSVDRFVVSSLYPLHHACTYMYSCRGYFSVAVGPRGGVPCGGGFPVAGGGPVCPGPIWILDTPSF